MEGQTEEGGNKVSGFHLFSCPSSGVVFFLTQLLDMVEMLNENYQSLVDSPDDPNVWKNRAFLILTHRFEWKREFKWKKELQLIEKFAEQHPKNYLFWDYRRWIIEKIGFKSITNELEFTKKILSAKGTKNYQAWSHRQWIIKNFDTSLWLDELQYCHEILEKDKFNFSAWDQIYHAVRLHPDIRNVHRDKESTYAKKAICAQPGNEGPWIYLKFLYADDKKRLYANPDLECIYVDVLAEAADRLKSSVELDPHCKVPYASVDSRGCIHALNLIVDLMALGYQADRNTRLVEAVDFLFDTYRCSYSWRQLPSLICAMNSEISRQVYALMCSFDADRIRYSYMFNGYPYFHETDTVDKPCETAIMDTPVSCVMSSQSQGRLNTILDCFITSLFQEHEWSNQLREKLRQSYLQKWEGRGIAEDDTLEDLKWDLRKSVVKNIGTRAFSAELDYTTGIIKENAYNRHAWSHRQWLYQTFSGDWVDADEAEIEFCRKILDKDSCNGFAWDQRYYVVKRWIPIIESASRASDPNDIGGLVFGEARKLIDSFDDRRIMEINYAINVIGSEPENQFPWSHIYGVCQIYFGFSYFSGPMVRDAILSVLQGTRDCVLGVHAQGEGVMGDGGRVATSVNAGGVMNALNMLSHIFFKGGVITKISKGEEEKYRDVLNVLCPNTCFGGLHEFDILIGSRMSAIMRHLSEGLAGHGLSWGNAADRTKFLR